MRQAVPIRITAICIENNRSKLKKSNNCIRLV